MNFSELVKSRYSVRSFQNTPIAQEQLDLILEAGRLSPSAHNSQPQRIFIARSAEIREKIAAVCPCTFGAPMILVVGYDRTRQRESKKNPGLSFGEIDSTIVCTQMMLQAHDLGIGSCWVGMFNREALSQALALPEEVTVIGLLVMGYPAANAEPLPLHFQKRELSETVSEL